MSHVVLLGDSIFDNAAYVNSGSAEIDQLRGKLPAGWRASLLAVDGHVTSHQSSPSQSWDQIPLLVTAL